MSDLAPFLAAVIESRVVSDLKRENDDLRREVQWLSAAAVNAADKGGIIETTGEGGFPVYASGRFKDAEHEYARRYLDLTKEECCSVVEILAAVDSNQYG